MNSVGKISDEIDCIYITIIIIIIIVIITSVYVLMYFRRNS